MKEIKIGTRNSPLAIWQAREVARHLQNLNYITDIVPIVSDEEMEHLNDYSDEDKKLFTKDLSKALQEGRVDITVHALKDIPLDLSDNIEVVAFLKRDFPHEVLVRNKIAEGKPMHELTVATNDPRRKALWLKQFPNAKIVEIKGNANNRLQKVEKGEVEATIVSLARLKRLNLNLHHESLPFIISAPSQGVVTVLGRTDNQEVNSLLSSLNDKETQYCAENERAFQKTLAEKQGLPIGAYAEVENNQVRFKGVICTRDGQNCVETDDIFDLNLTSDFGSEIAKVMLEKGAENL